MNRKMDRGNTDTGRLTAKQIESKRDLGIKIQIDRKRKR